MVHEFAKDRGLSTLEIFQEAYKTQGGIIFGLEAPDMLHQKWQRDQVSVPIYVIKFIRRKLKAPPH